VSSGSDWVRRPFGYLFDPRFRRTGRFLAASAAIGVVSGVGAIGFDLLFRVAQRLLLGGIGTFRPPASGVEGGPGFGPTTPWLLPVSLVVGGILAGLVVFGLAPEAEGHGTDAVLKAFHHLHGKIRRRVPIVKAVASAITIGSGGSAGREGPIAQIGAGFGSFIADALRLGSAERRNLMMAGAAGGIGSIFRAPLGAALFSAEVLYREPEFEYQVLIPGLVSAVVGYCIYSSYAGWGFLFDVPAISFHQPRQMVFYAALGLLCALVGNVYPRVFYGVRDRVFKPLPVPSWIKPAIGALLLGGLALVFPQCLGMGYGYIQEALRGEHTVAFLVAFAAAKILATSLTISSGGSGGVFGPSLVIGGAVGGAFGQAAAMYAPGFAPAPAASILVGMGGFFAGVAKVPFASVIMVMEMTGSYGLLVPSLVVAALAYLLVPPGVGLYENQVPTRVDSPAHLGSFAAGILRRFRLRDGWSPSTGGVPSGPLVCVRPDESLSRLEGSIGGSAQEMFPVVDASGALAGVFSTEDFRSAFLAEKPDAITVRDFMRKTDPLALDDELNLAAARLAEEGTGVLVVVEDRTALRPLGLFRREDLEAAYGRCLAKLREEPSIA
jgi:CIC family chloride channel protein